MSPVTGTPIAAATQVVTLADLKDYLGITADTENAQLNGIIAGVGAKFRLFTGRRIISGSWGWRRRRPSSRWKY